MDLSNNKNLPLKYYLGLYNKIKTPINSLDILFEIASNKKVKLNKEIAFLSVKNMLTYKDLSDERIVEYLDQLNKLGYIEYIDENNNFVIKVLPW